MAKQTLGDLIKSYEEVTNYKLPVRSCIIIRIDGRCFHTFTNGFEKPYDEIFIKSMQNTMMALCEEIQGCQFGYVQSDEISLLIYETNPEAEPWFGNRLQKICSASASFATLKFNQFFNEELISFSKDEKPKHYDAIKKGATFDSRVFMIPESVVNPYFIWRQNDCTRNSILGLSQKYYSHKQMMGLKCDELQNKLFSEKGINWNEESVVHKRGTCAYKVLANEENERYKWILDFDMPILTEDKNFVWSKIIFPAE